MNVGNISAQRFAYLRMLNEQIEAEHQRENIGGIVAKRYSLNMVGPIKDGTVYKVPGQDDLGELILWTGPGGPRFTYDRDGFFLQQMMLRELEQRVFERWENLLRHELDLFRKAVRGWIKAGKIPAGE